MPWGILKTPSGPPPRRAAREPMETVRSTHLVFPAFEHLTEYLLTVGRSQDDHLISVLTYEHPPRRCYRSRRGTDRPVAEAREARIPPS